MSTPLPTMSSDEVRGWIAEHVPPSEFAGQRVLMIIPDATRTAPLPLLFAALHERLADSVRQLDILVALGTHPPMPEQAICRMLGISEEDRAGRYSQVGL
jgi:nickel-dependent lactate racemase